MGPRGLQAEGSKASGSEQGERRGSFSPNLHPSPIIIEQLWAAVASHLSRRHSQSREGADAHCGVRIAVAPGERRLSLGKAGLLVFYLIGRTGPAVVVRGPWRRRKPVRGENGTMGTATGTDATKGDILGHPRGLWWLFTIEMWERFAYYGMRALLVLYLTKFFLFSDDFSYGLYGAFTSLVYLTPLVGGLLADKYLGSRKAVGFGAVLMTIGYLLLSYGGPAPKPVLVYGDQTFPMTIVEEEGRTQRYVELADGRHLLRPNSDGAIVVEGSDSSVLPAELEKGSYRFDAERDPFWVDMMFLALAIVIIGNGFFKPNISTMVGALYAAGDGRRDGGFTIFYMGINLGSIFSTILSPLIAVNFGFAYGFLSAALGMALSWIINEISTRKLGELGAPPDREALRKPVLAGLSREWTIYVLAVLSVALVWLLIQYQKVAGAFLIGSTIVAFIGVVGYSFIYCTRVERDRMLVAVILTMFSILFWALFEQAGSSLTLFAERNTDRVIEILGWTYEMPAGQVQVFNPLFVVLLAVPFSVMWTRLAAKGREPSTPVKFSLGLMQVGLGFLVLVWGSQMTVGADFKVPLVWLALAYLLHTTGELCLSPVGLSMITKLSVPRLVGLMMGVWFLSSSLAQYAGGLIARLASVETVGGEVLDPGKALATYLDVFWTIGWVAVVIGVFLFLISPFIRRMMHGVN